MIKNTDLLSEEEIGKWMESHIHGTLENAWFDSNDVLDYLRSLRGPKRVICFCNIPACGPEVVPEDLIGSYDWGDKARAEFWGKVFPTPPTKKNKSANGRIKKSKA